MATAKEISIALDDMLFLTGVYRSMRCNAIDYQLRLAQGQDPALVADIAAQNLARYKALLDTRQAVRDTDAKSLNNGLIAAGLDPAEHDTLLKSMLQTVSEQAANPATDAASIKALADDTLAKAPAPVLAAVEVTPRVP